ncbi:MAG: GNAT family N-acetyltransferase [Cyclobacteriaceae bacterium]|nr:GNAT family N-acetyltransferase [Cyclobacteriaceae bacterium]
MPFENTNDYQQPSLDHVEPVLPVRDVNQTIAYWRDVLGFQTQWTSGEPPDIGAVSWGAVHVQFYESKEFIVHPVRHYVWIKARQLSALYAMHQKNKAEIVTPFQATNWGFSEYIVQDLNGHHLIFTAPGADRQPVPKQTVPVKIVDRTPTFDEACKLSESVNWKTPDLSAYKQNLESTVYGVVAENSETGAAVGCAYLLGDGKSIFYVKDVIVNPLWQHQQIGTRLMHAIEQWLDKNAPAHATAGLFCGEQLAPFYKQFKFVQACGMYRVIDRK